MAKNLLNSGLLISRIYTSVSYSVMNSVYCYFPDVCPDVVSAQVIRIFYMLVLENPLISVFLNGILITKCLITLSQIIFCTKYSSSCQITIQVANTISSILIFLRLLHINDFIEFSIKKNHLDIKFAADIFCSRL